MDKPDKELADQPHSEQKEASLEVDSTQGEPGKAAETAQVAITYTETAVVATGEAIDPNDPLVNDHVRRQEAGVDEDNPLGRLGHPLSRRSPFHIGFTGALGVGVAYLLYLAIVNARNQLVIVIVSVFLAIGLNPSVVRLERLGMRRGYAVATVFLSVFAFFALVGLAIVPPVVDQVGHFIDALPNYLEDLRNNSTIRDLDEEYNIIDRAKELVSSGDVGSTAANGILGFGIALASAFFNAITILILTLYLLSSFNQIKRTAYRMVPRSRRSRVMLLGDEMLSRVGGYMAGAFLIALIAGTSTLIWLYSLGVPYPLALALIVTITDIIPLVGATIGAVIVSAVAFFVSLPVGLATAIFYLIYQQVENYLIYPRIMKRSVDVNPAAAIVAVLLGGSLLGIPGALLAVPITAAIQLILREVVMPRQEST